MRSAARGITIALALALAACGGTGSTGGTSTTSYQGKTIQLGAILSLTGAGGVYGPSSKKGADLAVETINNSGGVNGAKISLDTRDDASDKAQSAQVAQTLIQQGQLLALLGPTLSNSAVAVHPLAENFKIPILAVSTTGINIVPVPYKGGAPALVDLLGGHIPAMFDNMSTQLSAIKSGRTRALAVTSPRRTEHLPEVPTMIESGMKGYELYVWMGMLAPKATPAPVIERLHREFVIALPVTRLA